MHAFKQLSLSALTLSLAACGASGSLAELPGIPPLPAIPLTLACAPVVLPVVHGAEGGALDAPPAAWDWQAGWQSCEVLFPSKLHGTALYGVLFAPEAIRQADARLPVVVIGPGSGTGVQSQYQWSARELAAQGYIALTVNPQGVGNSEATAANPQSADNYVDAFVSGLDFIESTDNPLRQHTDTTRIGGAGHSLSAWAVSWLQGEDARLKAVVAWDNLASVLTGDEGTTSFGGPANREISTLIAGEVPRVQPARLTRPRVPAMGQSNDTNPTLNQGVDPEIKKTAFNIWHEAGVPSMQIAFLGKAHADWAQGQVASSDSASPKSQEMRLFQYYTRAWFDLWLKDDASAVARLTASQVLDGLPMEAIYSQQFHSALYLPGVGIDCPEIAAGGCPAFKP